MEITKDCKKIEKTFLLIGPTGTGKSFIANRFLKSKKFISELNCSSVTQKCQFITEKVIYLSDPEKQEMHVNLTIIDTPGLGDTQGKSREHIDSIIDFIKKPEITVDVIIIVLSETRLSSPLQNQL